MKETGGGAIVNESSLAGIKGIPDNSLYSASKHAVIGLTKTAALENAAEAVLFLCSDKASYITGATLEVDGGMSA